MNGKMIVIGIIILVLGLGGGYYFATANKETSEETPVVTPPVAETVATTPVATLTQAVTAAPTVDEKQAIIADVRAGLIAEHGPDAGSMSISVSKVLGDYAQGGASDEGGGGMWFAAKVGGTWKIVWDGNGIIQCSSLTYYPDFPKSMIPECYDKVTDKLIVR